MFVIAPCRRMELFDGFQLEAADLGNRYGGIICRVSSAAGCVRGSDVSTTLLPADMLS